jgi:hypothetical protein
MPDKVSVSGYCHRSTKESIHDNDNNDKYSNTDYDNEMVKFMMMNIMIIIVRSCN